MDIKKKLGEEDRKDSGTEGLAAIGLYLAHLQEQEAELIRTQIPLNSFLAFVLNPYFPQVAQGVGLTRNTKLACS